MRQIVQASTVVLVNFEWDPDKSAGNVRKHGVSFEEAASVFGDPLAVSYYDPDHSQNENRYILVGTSRLGRLLIVAYTERGENIRIISARKTTRRERKQYEESS